MKKTILSLALALALCLSLCIPALAAEDDARGVLHYEVTVAPQYDYARPYYDGLAAVEKDGKWGFIDEAGEVVIPFRYDVAFSFCEGKAVVGTNVTASEDYDIVMVDGEYREVPISAYYYDAGFIDKSGSYTPFTVNWYSGDTQARLYLEDSDIERDFILFHNGYTYFPSESGMAVAVQTAYAYGADGKCVNQGETLSYSAIGPANEGLIPVRSIMSTGWMNTDGTLAKVFLADMLPEAEPVIYEVRSFNQGLTPVVQGILDPSLGDYVIRYTWGFMDKNYEWAIPAEYEDYYINGLTTDYRVFGETGLAMVRRDGLYGAIDKSGKTVIPFAYGELWPVADGAIIYRDAASGLYGYLDAADNNVMIPARYQLATVFHNGIAVVFDGEKAFLINKKGEAVPGADNLDPNTYFHDGAITTPEEYVVINENGKYGIGRIRYLAPLPEKSEMHAWAYDEVVAAIEADLVPAGLQSLYRINIDRGEFCSLVMQALTEALDTDLDSLVEQKTGKTIDAIRAEAPFTDACEEDVLAAYALGIVNGRGNGVFDPYAQINRQEAAAFLMRAAKVLGMNTDNVRSAGFSDDASLASWGRDAVNFVYQIGVMNGTSTTQLTFSPKGTYTREQSFMTIYRLFEAFLKAP